MEFGRRCGSRGYRVCDLGGWGFRGVSAMTGFDSKRQAAKAKLTDEADTLLIVYQRGFSDGKRSAFAVRA